MFQFGTDYGPLYGKKISLGDWDLKTSVATEGYIGGFLSGSGHWEQHHGNYCIGQMSLKMPTKYMYKIWS